MNDGLSPAQRQMIIDALSACRQVDRAYLFGSRAMGNYKPASDVDLFLVGSQLGADQLLQIHRAIDDLPLAIDVDILVDSLLRSEDVRRHIREHGVLWWSRSDGE